MHPVRVVISVSALLAAITFVAVLVLAPLPERARGPAVVTATPDEQAARIRRALADARHAAAVTIANQTTEQFPQDPDAWLWQVIVQHALGHEAGARVAAEQLLRTTEATPVPAGPLTQSIRSYRLGWANWALSRHDVARSHFADAANLYLPSSEGLLDEATRQYNLASFFAMSGQPERAADHFARAVGSNYRDEDRWWKVDPDLDPIRTQQVYLDADAVLERREADRQRRRNERLGLPAGSPLDPPPPGAPVIAEPAESPASAPPDPRAETPEHPAPRS